MPAILDEAFQSPFNNYKDLNPHGALRGSDTESSSINIRNPQWSQTDNVAIKNFKQASAESCKEESPDKEVYKMMEKESIRDYDQCDNLKSAHDKLINRILSCKRCNEKLRCYIEESHGGSSPEIQRAGAPDKFNLQTSWENLSTTTMGNFAFGIALILLLDKIVKLKK